MSRKYCVLLLLLPLLLSGWAFDPAPVQAQDDRLNVVATTTQVADLARIIGDDRIQVTGLMGGGVDPHLYQFTESDIQAMTQADLVLYSGLHLEGGIGEVIEAIGNRTRVYAVGDTIDRLGYVLMSPDDPDVQDPHIWFDPRNWMEIADGVADVLAQEDPDNADFYRERAAEYQEQLQELYDWGVAAMQVVPEEQRALVTSHDAFQYFGDAFGWEVRGLQGISTDAEAGVGDIQALADFVIERDIPAMFVESSVPPNTIRAVQSAVRSRGGTVEIGGELFSDAMGEVGTYYGTYIGMLRYNIETVLSAFGYLDEMPPWPETLPVPEDFEPNEEPLPSAATATPEATEEPTGDK